MRDGLTLLVLLSALGLGGCDGAGADGDADADTDGDGDSEPDADGDFEPDAADVDADGDSDGGPEAGPLTVLVTTHASMAEAPRPAAGARVALDGPDGTRLETEAEADGTVTFEAVDWAAGPTAAVTAFVDDHVAASWAALTAASAAALANGEGRLELALPPLVGRGEPLVEVGGAISGIADSRSTLSVSTTLPGRASRDRGPTYAVGVPPGLPFELVAFEYGPPGTSTVGPRGVEQSIHGWATARSDGVEAAATVDLDLATGPEPEPFAFAFRFPATVRRGFFSACSGFASESSIDSALGLLNGWPTRVDVTVGGGTFEVEGERVPLDGVAAPVTVYALWTEEAGSRVVRDGPPPAETVELPFPEPAEVVRPGGATAHPISEPVEWTMRDEDRGDAALPARIVLRRTGDSVEVHQVWLPPGTLSAVVPELPAGADREALYGPGRLQGNVQHCEPDPAAPGLCRRWSSGRWFLVTP